MYTKNQVAIMDTEQKIDIVKDTMLNSNDKTKEVCLKQLLKQLQNDLGELYSKE